MTVLELLCHRLPERSFWFGDQQSLFCSRCTGLYLGVLLAGIVCLTLKSAMRSVGPSRALRRPALLLVMLMCIDVFAGAWQLRAGTNALRLATGFGAGCGMGLLLLPPLLSRMPFHLRSAILRRSAAIAWMTGVPAVAVLALLSVRIGMVADYLAVAGAIVYAVSVWLTAFRAARTAFAGLLAGARGAAASAAAPVASNCSR